MRHQQPRHRPTPIRNAVFWIATSSCCWMAAIFYAMHTGEAVRFAHGGSMPTYQVSCATQTVQEASADSYAPLWEKAKKQ
jgi:hypothetical protein